MLKLVYCLFLILNLSLHFILINIGKLDKWCEENTDCASGNCVGEKYNKRFVAKS